MEITSLSNAKVKYWAKLKEKKYRDQEHAFLVEGEHLVQEAYQQHCLDALIVLQGHPFPQIDLPVYEVTNEIIQKLTSLTSKETLLGVCHTPEIEGREENRLILLDGVQDPGNLGTIIRTAISFGYDAVVLSHDCVDVYNEKVIRSTQGAIFHLPIYRKDFKTYLPELKQQGMTLYATALQDASPLQSIRPNKRFALIFGNEGNGVREETLALSDKKVKIEMDTFESLNVAVAAGICMYIFRQF